MTDSSPRKHVRVSTAGAWSHIMVTVDKLDEVRNILSENDIRHWVEHNTISIDGRPAVAFVNLDKRCDPIRVQALLDAVP